MKKKLPLLLQAAGASLLSFGFAVVVSLGAGLICAGALMLAFGVAAELG